MKIFNEWLAKLISSCTPRPLRPGDRVTLCISGRIGWESEYWIRAEGLIPGEVYVVESVDLEHKQPSVTIKDTPYNLELHPDHFKLIR